MAMPCSSHARWNDPDFGTFDDRVLIYVHKEEELAEVERLYPADHYVLIDDKLRILAAVKKLWGERVTTVFPLCLRFKHPGQVSAGGR